MVESKILNKISLDDCYEADWLNSNEVVIETGLIFHRSKLPNDQTIFLRLNYENNFIKFILKLKPTKLFYFNQTIITESLDNDYYSLKSHNKDFGNLTVGSTTRRINSIRIQVMSKSSFVKLQCISDIQKASYNWSIINGTFADNAIINNDTLAIESFTNENIGVYQCLAFNKGLNQQVVRRVNLNTIQHLSKEKTYDVSDRLKIENLSDKNNFKKNGTIILQCSIGKL